LENIARNPRARHPGVELLTGRDREYRVRQGNWRVIYTVTD
jgi:mRNA-degrading endonuclease RelE of RelBE toxin-antitoxin system